MLNISYNISPRLKEYLDKIENLRRQILLTPIAPKTELRLKWDAIFNRTYSCLKLAGNPLDKEYMQKLLGEITHKKIKKEEQEIIKYKTALDFISQNWTGSTNAINSQSLIELHRLIGNGKLRVPEAGLQYLLDYLQARSENPIIQAGILSIEMEKMQLFSENNKLISYLAPLIFLYKYGYDFRGFLAYETEWLDDSKSFKDNHERALTAVSLTLWLEYFASCILKRLDIIIQSLDKPKSAASDLKEAFWDLNERQRSILAYLGQPQATITNRQIQKKHKVSQITASRDLAKLTNLGHLFSHGKGRSVYYTKI